MTRAPDKSAVDRIDALLPQTQCAQCGYPGCRPYAEAIAAGAAGINQCPPGGDSGIHALATLLGRPFEPLNPANGVEKPRTVAYVVEADCIGCTKCIQVCPVDAIVGAGKRMHTVIADHCTGCELCVPACPVDCIVLEPMPAAQLDAAHADAARQRFQRRNARKQAMHAPTPVLATGISRNAVLEAIARAKARRRGRA
jgi:electron transport complex protein RnfB